MTTQITDLKVFRAVTEFLGIRSELDIATITDTGKRYEIILDCGNKLYANVEAIDRYLNGEKSKNPIINDVYTIKKRFNMYSGVAQFTLVDYQGFEVVHQERQVSTIFTPGMTVFINNKREITYIA